MPVFITISLLHVLLYSRYVDMYLNMTYANKYYIVFIYIDDCPYTDDIQCDSICYRSDQICYGKEGCSNISLNCSKLILCMYVFVRICKC